MSAPRFHEEIEAKETAKERRERESHETPVAEDSPGLAAARVVVKTEREVYEKAEKSAVDQSDNVNKQMFGVGSAETDEQKKIREEGDKISRADKHKAWLALSLTERMQAVADKRFKGSKRYAIRIPGDKVPTLVHIQADAPEEAMARYDDLCGIKVGDTDHEYICLTK